MLHVACGAQRFVRTPQLNCVALRMRQGRAASPMRRSSNRMNQADRLVPNTSEDPSASSTTTTTSQHHAPPTAPTSKAELKMPLNPQRRRGFKIMGLNPSPELLAISMVYFVQGILGLSRLALSFFFKDDLHIEPAQVALLTGFANIPWMIKPLYGFVSDTIPLFGYRRRSYLVLCGLMGTVAWSMLATTVTSPAGAVSMMVLGSLSTAFSDVVVDSIVVERARGEPQTTSGSLQSLCWSSSAVGGIISAYFSGSLVEDYGVRAVFGLTALFPLIVSLSALLINEARTSGAAGRHEYNSLSSTDSEAQKAKQLPATALVEQLRTQVQQLWTAVGTKSILLPTAFVFLWQATPSAESAMFYYYTNQLKFQPEFLGRVRLAGSIASLAGVGLYNTFLKRIPLRRMLTWAMVLGVLLGSTQLLLVSGLSRQWGISDEYFVLGDSVILTVLAQVSFMPILVLAARLCPEGVEATLFATLMSILNSGAFVGSALGAVLTSAFGVTSTKFTALLPLLAVCNFSGLLPAPFLGLLPPDLDHDKEELEIEMRKASQDGRIPAPAVVTPDPDKRA